MSRVDTYRRKATELRRRARAEANVSTRPELELLALAFDRLADQAEHNTRDNLVYEYADAISDGRKQQRQLAQRQQQQQRQSKRHQ